jgi:carotenoid cleavage dioxygenase-like enzyme
MTRFVGIASIGLVALIAGCGGSDVTQPPGTPLSVVRLRSEPYSFSYYSGLNKPARLVIRDAIAWRTVWNQIYATQTPVPSLPEIDFSREMVIVAALGSRSTGGYGILLTAASEAEDEGAVVIVDSSSPGSNCMVTDAFTQPVDIARLPLRRGSVTFTERSHVSNCG